MNAAIRLHSIAQPRSEPYLVNSDPKIRDLVQKFNQAQHEKKEEPVDIEVFKATQGAKLIEVEKVKEDNFVGPVTIINWAMTRRQKVVAETSFDSIEFDIYAATFSSQSSVEASPFKVNISSSSSGSISIQQGSQEADATQEDPINLSNFFRQSLEPNRQNVSQALIRSISS